MVLKVAWERVVEPSKGKEAECCKRDRIFDGFNDIAIQDVVKGSRPIPESGAFCFYHETANFEVVKEIILFGKHGEEARYVYVDRSYDVYLMSDSGKTLEKIN